MKFKVRVSELRYGDVVVEAGSEDEAKTLATGAKIDFFDSEITDMTVEPLRKDGHSREIPAALAVDTPLGTIVVKAALDSQHPGVYVDLRRPGTECDLPLALVEFSADDADFIDGDQNIITRVWGNARQEDYTMRTVHQNIEQYFKSEEGN